MKKALLALVFGSALFLAACGGGDDTADKNTDEAVNNNQGATENTGDNTNDTTGGTDTTGDTATDTETADTGDVAKGEAVVNKACITCHGANLEGMGNFPALNDVGSRLSQDEILNVINNGRGAMPAGVVKGEDAEAAAAYLATLK